MEEVGKPSSVLLNLLQTSGGKKPPMTPNAQKGEASEVFIRTFLIDIYTVSSCSKIE